MRRLTQKEAGAYYTPDPVVSSLLQWAVRREDDRLLDPACGDGRFIAGHRNAVGIEQDLQATQVAMARAPWALVHEGDFFSWAAETGRTLRVRGGQPAIYSISELQWGDSGLRNRSLRVPWRALFGPGIVVGTLPGLHCLTPEAGRSNGLRRPRRNRTRTIRRTAPGVFG
ncbi:N-6 DNA methylase [Bradyrhizobium sp. LM2.3]